MKSSASTPSMTKLHSASMTRTGKTSLRRNAVPEKRCPARSPPVQTSRLRSTNTRPMLDQFRHLLNWLDPFWHQQSLHAVWARCGPARASSQRRVTQTAAPPPLLTAWVTAGSQQPTVRANRRPHSTPGQTRIPPRTWHPTTKITERAVSLVFCHQGSDHRGYRCDKKSSCTAQRIETPEPCGDWDQQQQLTGDVRTALLLAAAGLIVLATDPTDAWMYFVLFDNTHRRNSWPTRRL